LGITVKIGGVDKTEYVDARTLSIRDELTSKVNSASFDFICNDIAVAPIPGEAVLIEEGANKLFSGRILSKEESFLPPNLLKYPVECIDHTRDLDKKLVSESYKNQKAGDIYKHIIDNYTIGFTYNNVSDGPIISEIAFDFVQVSEVLTKIAEICGYEFYVDYDQDIHFFAKNTYPAPFQLDDNQANYKDLIINTNISQLRNRIYVKSSGLEDTFGEIFIYDGVATEWTCKFAPINRGREKLPDPDPKPARGVWRCDLSHDDIYLAVPYEKVVAANKGIYIYKRENDLFKRLNFPDVTPNNDGHDTSFSPDSTYLTVVHAGTPYVMIYKRAEDTFTKLTNPDILPTGTGWGCDFSPDGIYLAIAHNASPYITIYKRSGDTFTKLANPANLPTGDGFGCKFSPDGVYLAVAHNTTPFITIYKRTGDTFTKLTDPASLPAGWGLNVTWTPDSIYLAVGHDTTPFITMYKRAGDVFTKQTNPAELPTGPSYGVDFSPDGIQLAVAHSTTPFVTIYTRTGDILGKQIDLTDLPTGNGRGAIFSHNGKYLVIGHMADPYIIIYKQYSPTIKVDGIIKTIGWDEVDNPLYYDFMLNEKTKVLSIGAAGTQMIDVGTLVSDSTVTENPNFTCISKSNPANTSGKITQIKMYAYTNLSNCKVATFYRPDPVGFPNKFSTRDTETIGTVISGSEQTFDVDLEVVEGDYIGIHYTAGYLHRAKESGGRWYINEDKIPCENQTFTPSSSDDALSLYGTGSIGEGELTIGSELLVGYTTFGVPICFKRENQDSIDKVSAIEGGDGIIEFCLVDNNIDSIAWANDAAKADLLQNANPIIQGTFITNRSDIWSGQIITLISTKRNINQQFIIQKVELVRVDVLTEWPTIPYKPAVEAVIGYKPASEAEKGYRAAGDSGGIIYYIFNVTIANKFRKLEDLFIYLLNRTDESLK
jgi:WD40 repeat protein